MDGKNKSAAVEAFNSLFEMPPCRATPRRHFPPSSLSILYLRCSDIYVAVEDTRKDGITFNSLFEMLKCCAPFKGRRF